MRHRAFVIAALVTSCRADAPSLVVDITSELEIPSETNSLAVRIRADDREPIETIYALGDAPRDQWPQSLPIVSGDDVPQRLNIEGELRVAQEGQPSVVVGYGDVETAFELDQEAHVTLTVARACVDADGDGFGIGFGCASPDCDDADPKAPGEYFCGDAPPRDGGVFDAEPTDGGRDAGVEMVRDGGGPDEPCGTDICEMDEACFIEQCRKKCMNNADCGALHLGCLTRYGVCICRVPCLSGTDCGPLECLDGCCQI